MTCWFWHRWFRLPLTDCRHCHDSICTRCFAVVRADTKHDAHLVAKPVYR